MNDPNELLTRCIVKAGDGCLSDDDFFDLHAECKTGNLPDEWGKAWNAEMFEIIQVKRERIAELEAEAKPFITRIEESHNATMAALGKVDTLEGDVKRMRDHCNRVTELERDRDILLAELRATKAEVAQLKQSDGKDAAITNLKDIIRGFDPDYFKPEH